MKNKMLPAFLVLGLVSGAQANDPNPTLEVYKESHRLLSTEWTKYNNQLASPAKTIRDNKDQIIKVGSQISALDGQMKGSENIPGYMEFVKKHRAYFYGANGHREASPDRAPFSNFLDKSDPIRIAQAKIYKLQTDAEKLEEQREKLQDDLQDARKSYGKIAPKRDEIDRRRDEVRKKIYEIAPEDPLALIPEEVKKLKAEKNALENAGKSTQEQLTSANDKVAKLEAELKKYKNLYSAEKKKRTKCESDHVAASPSVANEIVKTVTEGGPTGTGTGSNTSNTSGSVEKK